LLEKELTIKEIKENREEESLIKKNASKTELAKIATQEKDSGLEILINFEEKEHLFLKVYKKNDICTIKLYYLCANISIFFFTFHLQNLASK
jgi:hypothetical protein